MSAINATKPPGQRLTTAAGLPYRGSRCGRCYWALYDGETCQNQHCIEYQTFVGKNRINLTNDEAKTLIDWKGSERFEIERLDREIAELKSMVREMVAATGTTYETLK